MSAEISSVAAARTLSFDDHDREVAGMRYVYPVLSRRAEGVSLGINLNPNNACNWHCAYCQVPDLKRGAAPAIDLSRLEHELSSMLEAMLHGDFLHRFAPEGMRILRDMAFSGNGEPTSSGQFADAVSLVGGIMERFGLVGRIPLRLITNGSYMSKGYVRQGLSRMADLRGEVWIKVDAADPASAKRINGVRLDADRLFEQVATSAMHCPTWIQTCMVAWDEQEPGEELLEPYLALLRRFATDGLPLEGVLLYSLARPSCQRESSHVSPLPLTWLDSLADVIRAIGFSVKVF
ncbi:MAG: radical SAM protein [Zetaproteobacteria bacterium]|nr:MAG: radical SAM protein [Zetaproteobacteria bacterium]